MVVSHQLATGACSGYILAISVWWLTLQHAPTVSATVHVVGAGATFPRNVYQVWMSAYAEVRREYLDVSLTYSAKGSGVGQERIKGALEPAVDFAGSDSVLTEQEYIEHPDLQMFPVMAG